MASFLQNHLPGQTNRLSVYGVDFTSAPSKRKPIVLAACQLEGRTLTLQTFRRLSDFPAFEAALQAPGPWVMALDFPFSLPAVFVADMGWPTQWQAYVPYLAERGLPAFVETIKAYRQARLPGQKYHFRAIDRTAGACSPMMIDYTPVGRMFFQGAPRLLASGATVLPFGDGDRYPERVAMEGYPGWMVRQLADAALLGKVSYKSDEPRKQTVAKREARALLLNYLEAGFSQARYGILLVLDGSLRQAIIEDPTGDSLDALLCAIQAAWAAHQPRYGMPEDAHFPAGWIADPAFSGSRALASR
jgi:hypothetical protein